MINFFKQWFSGRTPPEYRPRVLEWQAIRVEEKKISLDKANFIVVDIETTGLEPSSDKLVSIGAVPIRRGRLQLGNSFHGVLRQMYRGNRENIIIHGITPADQARGEPPADLLVDFLEVAEKHPMVAFHAPFDRHFLRRAYREFLGVKLANSFLDLAWVLPALYPDEGKSLPSLDAWVEHFGLSVSNRHSAVEDALVTAELFLIALSKARERRINTVQGLFHLAEEHARFSPAATLMRK